MSKSAIAGPSAEVIDEAVKRTREAGPYAVRVSMSYRNADVPNWEAVGAIDPVGRRSRLLFHADGSPEPFREVAIEGTAVYERMDPRAGTWRLVRQGPEGERPLTANLFSFARFRLAAVRWTELASSDIDWPERAATGYRAALRHRLGDRNDGTIAILFRETLPTAYWRRRALDVFVDDAGLVSTIALTGEGLRYEPKRLRLDLASDEAIAVPALDAEHVLTGPWWSRARQQWAIVR